MLMTKGFTNMTASLLFPLETRLSFPAMTFDLWIVCETQLSLDQTGSPWLWSNQTVVELWPRHHHHPSRYCPVGCSVLPQSWNFASKLGQPMRIGMIGPQAKIYRPINNRIPVIFVFNGNFNGEMGRFWISWRKMTQVWSIVCGNIYYQNDWCWKYVLWSIWF